MTSISANPPDYYTMVIDQNLKTLLPAKERKPLERASQEEQNDVNVSSTHIILYCRMLLNVVMFVYFRPMIIDIVD